MDGSRSKLKTFLINEVATRVDLSQKRIREYEKANLIRPLRAPNTNNRLYTSDDIRQIERIKELIHEHGFTVACLQRLLGAAPCWNIFNCTKKETCPAFHAPHTPCYLVMKGASPLHGQECDACAVYLNRNPEKFKILEKIRPAGR